MQSMKQTVSLLALSLTLAACNAIPNQAFFNRGAPESLLDASSEVVNVPLTSERSIDELVQWVNQDQPARAEVICMEGDSLCSKAQRTLEQFGVPVYFVSAGDNVVSLSYERVVARDCENRFLDNTVNPYNMNHPTFGCSVASNMVQMVSDKQQFTNPALTDYMDGEKAVQVIDNYRKPPVIEANKDKLIKDVKNED